MSVVLLVGTLLPHFEIKRLIRLAPYWRAATCADPESLVRDSGQLWQRFLFVFLVDEGRVDPNITISGSSPARQRNAIGSQASNV